MLRNLFLLSILFLVTSIAGCGATSPVVNIQDSEIDLDNRNVSAITVRNAIIRAGHQHGWRMRIIKRGQILATMKREGYMAKTVIRYSPRKYSIKYKDSSNLRYDGNNIHSFYNEWVEQLDDEIKTQLH